MDESDDRQGSDELRAIHANLHATPPPDMEALAALMERLQPLTQHAEDVVVAEARRLELRILGEMLNAQAATLRNLAR
ncbi:MAG: hypothetical protein HC822_28275 [Oscillochloris sp.]|nr:hypothetical protein [Oscillochloris sp.]